MFFNNCFLLIKKGPLTFADGLVNLLLVIPTGGSSLLLGRPRKIVGEPDDEDERPERTRGLGHIDPIGDESRTSDDSQSSSDVSRVHCAPPDVAKEQIPNREEPPFLVEQKNYPKPRLANNTTI